MRRTTPSRERKCFALNDVRRPVDFGSEHAGGRKTYGHSLIVAPWGEILGELGTSPGVLVADLDMIRLRQLREKFPVVQHRREL